MPPTYKEVYARWRAAPEAFWAEAAEAVHWYRKWDAVLDRSRAPFYRWFPGGQTNSCYNALDRHVENGRADQVALIYDSPVTSTVRSFTYRELRDEVARFAGVLAKRGVSRGDRVVIYMPMVPETVIAMLACARIGAIHSVVFGGFASPELASRITDARPKAILTASCGIEIDRVVPYKPLLDRAIELATFKPECCIVLQRPQGWRRWSRDGTTTGHLFGSGVARGLRPAPRHRSALHPLYLRHHRESQRHRARQRRPPGRAHLEHAQHLRRRARARCTGPRPTWAGPWATPTSSTARCSTATRPSYMKESRWARPMQARSGE